MPTFLHRLSQGWRNSDNHVLATQLCSENDLNGLALSVVLVGMVTFHSGRILLLQRSKEERFHPGAWSVPAGKAMPGEPLEDAALRELKEEAGVLGNIPRFLGSVWFDSSYQGRKVHNLQVNFAVDAASADVKLDGSNEDFHWLPVSELSDPPVPLDGFTRKVVNSAIDGAMTNVRQLDRPR
jgi:8-oxo-dGTP diphosphatase